MNMKAVYNGNHPQDIARREGVKRGALLGSIVTVIVTLGLCIVIHAALMMRSENNAERIAKMDREASAMLLDTCRKDVARYADIAAVEQAYAERRTP